MYNEKMFSLDVTAIPENLNVITESVFKNGKEKIKSIQDAFDELGRVYSEMKKGLNTPSMSYEIHEKFYRHDAWKQLEKAIIETLGVRSVIFQHMSMKSRLKNKSWMNCFTYVNLYDRFPIDGLITDDGFYDSSHTLMCQMIISQELFDVCTSEEITAIFLHELGHNIDPALVDIKYMGSDLLIDSMLGRKPSESKINKLNVKHNLGADAVLGIIYMLFILIMVYVPMLVRLFESKEKKMEKIKRLLTSAKEFNKKDNTEAYADNIARMYGYGSALMTGLKKLGINNSEIALYSYRNRAKRREKEILNMYIDALSDVHGTDVQRIIALIKEYDNDLKDETIPKPVKKWIEEDKKRLELLLDKYTNDKDELTANVNKMIKDAMREPAESTSNIKESVDIFEEKKSIKEYISLTPDERKIADERFGKIGCIIMKDDNGYFAKTHRCRCKSYPTLELLPKKSVDFVSRTS